MSVNCSPNVQTALPFSVSWKLGSLLRFSRSTVVLVLGVMTVVVAVVVAVVVCVVVVMVVALKVLKPLSASWKRDLVGRRWF